MRFCLECGIEITRKLYGKDTGKYCSRSCSTIANNRVRSKRSGNIWGSCILCGAEVSTYKANQVCRLCKPRTNALANKTLAGLRAEYNINQYHAKVRGNARAVYLASGKPKECYVCGYSLHVDICHIVDVQDFDMAAKIEDVNNISNLVALCKNHHWEFDNRVIKLNIAEWSRGTTPVS